jgi:hypothetical protein
MHVRGNIFNWIISDDLSQSWSTVDSRCLELGWVEFLSKSRTLLCINIYNLTPVESNSDESKFRWSRIKVLVPRCRKPYYLHSLSRIYQSKHVYYLGIKIGSQVKHPVIDWHFYLRLFHMFILTICQIN